MLYRKMLGSKIHRARVTQADLSYEGSVTISPELLQAANLRPYEAVNIWNVTSGTRLETYAISGRPGSTDICINGAAAHLISPGDIVIIARFVQIEEKDVGSFKPIVVFVDEQNRIKEIREEIPGPEMAATHNRLFSLH